MSFWIWLEKGHCMPGSDTPGRRFACWFGRKMACRHPKVTIDTTARISPNARIHPRCGKIVIGKNSSVAPNAVVQGNVVLGENTSVQYNTMLVGYGKPDAKQGLIQVGSNVRIAANCMVIAANHIFRDPNIPIYQQGVEPASITIEDDVWIGGGVHITAGVTIGKGSVIGAGSVVTKDIPPYSVAVGAPCKVIKQRV